MSKLLAILVCISAITFNNYTAYAQDAGVSAVLAPATGSVLVFGNSYTVTATVHNYGSTTLTSIPLKFNVGFSTPLEEIWIGTLAAGASIDHTFSTQFVLSDTSISSAYCLADVNGDVDVFNNSFSPSYTFTSPVGMEESMSRGYRDIAITDFMVLSGQEVRFNIASNTDASASEVSIVSLNGQRVLSQFFKGTNSSTVGIDISSLSHGLYMVVVSGEYGTLTKKFVI